MGSEKGDVGRIAQLVRSGISVNSEAGYFPYWTPLMYAAKNNRLEAAKFLCENGAKLNYMRSECQSTAAHFAASRAMLKLLVDFGADLDYSDMWGRTPVDLMKKD